MFLVFLIWFQTVLEGRLKTARPPSARPAAPRLKEKTEIMAEEIMQARYHLKQRWHSRSHFAVTALRQTTYRAAIRLFWNVLPKSETPRGGGVYFFIILVIFKMCKKLLTEYVSQIFTNTTLRWRHQRGK